MLVGKCGKKFDRSRYNWTTYNNFIHMYTQIYEEAVCTKVAGRLLSQILMYRISPYWANKIHTNEYIQYVSAKNILEQYFNFNSKEWLFWYL